MTEGSPNRAEFGRYIRRARKHPPEITQEEVAYQIGVESNASISRYERGQEVPRGEHLERLIDYFHGQRRWSDAEIAEIRRLHALAEREGPPRPRTAREVPLPEEALIGRERDVRQVLDLLRGPGPRWVELIGPGGIGKTVLALAVAVAYRREAAGASEIAFIDLATVRTRGGLLAALTRQLGIREGRSSRARTDDGEAHLTDLIIARLKRTRLLILDACEGVRPEASPIGDLLRDQRLGRLRVLLTSRVRLQLGQVYDVPLLAVPPAKRPLDLGELGDVASVALLLARIRREWREFDLTGANAEAIVAICRALEGLPLALELLAPQCAPSNVRGVASQLTHRLALLQRGPPILPERHRTLTAVLDWSYELLAEPERLLFRRLGVCHGCDRAALEQLCALGARSLSPAREPLTLVRNSLAILGGAEPESRMYMLEVIREYALEKLQASAEYEQVRAWHTKHYGGVARRAHDLLALPDPRAGLALLDREQDNLTAVLQTAADDRSVGDIADIAHVMRLYWGERGRLTEGQDWLRRLMDLPLSLADRARLLVDLGELAVLQGRYERAEEYADRAAFVAPGRLDRSEIAAVGRLLGDCDLGMGDYDDAIARYGASLEYYRALRDERNETETMRRIGLTYRRRREYGEAAAWYRRALERTGPIARSGATATLLADLADVRRLSLDGGDHEEAAALADEAIDIAREIGAPLRLAHALDIRAKVDLIAAGSLVRRHQRSLASPYFARAGERFAERLAILWELEHTGDVAQCLLDLALTARECGRPTRAALLLGASQALMDELNMRLDSEGEEICRTTLEALRGQLVLQL